MRVQRGFNTAQQITSLFERVASSGYEDLTPEDRLAVLDLPDVDAVAFNISSITALSRSALIQRAAESPELLTETELDLLLDRYWVEITHFEQRAQMSASELERRGDLEATLRHNKDLQDALASFKGPDWARRLLEEEKADKPWGFARYVDPTAAKHFDSEHYFARTDTLLTFAKTNDRYGDLLCRKFHLQRLDWPGSDPNANCRAANVTQQTQNHEGQELDERDAARVYMASKQPDQIGALRTKFRMLSEHFRLIRDRPRLPRCGSGGQCRYDGLIEGMLSNAFIVIDGACISSLYTVPRYADDVWVWAVDPDHDDSNVSTSSGPDSEAPQYQGFLSVRIQQLADKFFEARFKSVLRASSSNIEHLLLYKSSEGREMDPFTIAASVAKIISSCLVTGKAIYDLSCKYQDAPRNMVLISSEMTVVSASLSHIQTLNLSKQDRIAPSIKARDRSCLDEEIKNVTKHARRVTAFSWKGKIKVAWKHETFQELFNGTRGQQLAINTLIQLLQTDLLLEITRLLKRNAPDL
ncbi:hypothetical protein MBLNU13_g06679t1 [Cladosporium sp. NU13]